MHIILDNLSAHKTQAVREFVQQHPRVRFHFTPTYSSWLNQVETWFAKIEREVIARGRSPQPIGACAKNVCRVLTEASGYPGNPREIGFYLLQATASEMGNSKENRFKLDSTGDNK
jgi:hypothetical protein